MKRSDIRNIVKEELASVFAEADKADKDSIAKATKADETRLRQAFASMAKRASGAGDRREIVTQVIKKLASALGSSPTEIAQSFLGVKKAQKADKKAKK